MCNQTSQETYELLNWMRVGAGAGVSVLLVFRFCISQIKTAMFVVYLGPYIGSRARFSICGV